MLERAKHAKKGAEISGMQGRAGPAKRHGSTAGQVSAAPTPHGICPNQAFQYLGNV
jgi:hypothetical protein